MATDFQSYLSNHVTLGVHPGRAEYDLVYTLIMIPLIFQSIWNNTVSSDLHLHPALDLDHLVIFLFLFQTLRADSGFVDIWRLSIRHVLKSDWYFGGVVTWCFCELYGMKWHGIYVCSPKLNSCFSTKLPYPSPWSCRFISQAVVLRPHRACSPSLVTWAWTCPQLSLLTFTVVTNSAFSPVHPRDLFCAIYFHCQDSITPSFLRLREISVDVIVVITFAGS